MTRTLLCLSVLFCALAVARADNPKEPAPPAAKKVATPRKIHDDKLVDNYRWLQDKKNREVISYLEAENAYTEAKTTHLKPFAEKLYKEALCRIQQTDQAVPVRDNGYWYYTRTVEAKQYPIHCRKKGTLDAEEEVLLDGNEMAKGHKFFSLGGYDSTQYASERIWATAPDGVKVPISLVYKKTTKRDGSAPLWLNGYGSYGASSSVGFSSSNLLLLDRGLIVATAHIRGGGDLGKKWHDDGKMLNKKNTFTDFIACADHLVKEKYTSRDRLAIEGASAGGLLIGVVVNFRPDLCKVAVLGVPFVDVINTMLDPSLPLTIQEYLEWGNPNKRSEYEYMRSYCPYTNLKAVNYPAMFVFTSLNDSQVMYWEPAKYVAKLRTLKPNKTPLLLKTNMAGGHGGSSGRYDVIKERTARTAFVLSHLGVTK